MHLRAQLDTPLVPSLIFPWVEDLTRYPAWLDIVRSATGPCGVTGRQRPGDDTELAWDVVLEARVGPFRRGKQLRMVRTAWEPDRLARFERCERDGKDHASWVLAAELEPAGTGSALVMDLSYSGSLFGPAVEALLKGAIEQAKPRLVACAEAGG